MSQHLSAPRRTLPILILLAIALVASLVGLAFNHSGAAASYSPAIASPDTSWQQQFQLKSTNGTAQSFFGNDVAISGNTAIVGDFREGGAFAGAAYIFVRNGAKWSQQQRLSPSAFGRSPEVFGFSVAISGDTAVVGAIFTSFDNEQGGVNTAQGAAFVYKRSGDSWLPEQMLTAADGNAGDRFGYSVAISGETILVSAFEHSHVAYAWQGAVYVFTRTNSTWSQQQELLGDQQAGSAFAYDLALSGDTAIIVGANDNGANYKRGKAFFFERSGAVWTKKQMLTASDYVPGDCFLAVAISGDTAFVSYSNSSAGNTPPDPNRQGAYVFERSGGIWSQKQRLTVNDSLRPFSYCTVAIDRETAILGFPESAPGDVSQTKGAAYIFTHSGPTWVEQKKLIATELMPHDGFGGAVGISGETAIVGAVNATVDGHPGQGAAYIFLKSPDTDGDGLPDDWEKNGVVIDGEFIDLPAMGADPMHKDIFVHADWMGADPARPGVVIKPERRAIKIVVDAFSIAPVENPDHQPGINLHVDLGPTSVLNYVTGATTTWGSLSRASEVPFQTRLGSTDPGGDYNWSAVDAIKALHFTPAKRRAVFHYVVFANNYDPGTSSGISRGLNAADFIVALGDWSDPGGTLMQQAGTFMHELGHNLGLHHGGDDDINKKPNYLSIMNYSFQNLGIFQPLGRQRSFDYSREVLPLLDERNLDEFKGIGDPGLHFTLWNKRTRADVPTGSNACFANADYFKIFFPTDALDWDCDGAQTATPVSADINGDGNCVSLGANLVVDSIPAGDDVEIHGIITAGANRTCETTAAGDDEQEQSPGFVQPNLLKGFKDWPALQFDGGGSIGTLGVGPLYPQSTHRDEPTLAQLRDVAPDGERAEELAAPLDVVTVSPPTGPVPLQVSFDGRGSTAVNGTIVSWTWKFGDGSTGTGAVVSHTYNATGAYFATLTVEDSNGHVNLVPLLTRVLVTDPTPPTPTPTPTPIAPLPGRPITNVADSTLGFASLDPPAINNDRTLLFAAVPPNGLGGLYTKSSSSTLTTIAQSGNLEFPSFNGGFPSLNASGTVAFITSRGSFGAGVSRVLVKNAGVLTTIADDQPASPFEHFNASTISINNSGAVAFFGHLRNGADGIFSSNGASVSTVAETHGGTFRSFLLAPAINAGGTVAFEAATNTGRDGIFTVAPSGALTTIADTSGVFRFFYDVPSINTAGTVAFRAATSTAAGIYTGNGGAITTVVQTTGFDASAFSGFVDFTAINDAGTVAFGGLLRDGRRGIFVGPDVVTDKVIATGDALFGSIVTNVGFFRGLNQNGDIAFNYELQNHVKGVAFASPPATPTPSPTPTPTPIPTPTPVPGVLQFSASNYDVQEDCIALQLTIVRTGDSSSAATVDFATSDGSALQRTDYTIMAGTVVFNPGEKSTTFDLLITQDEYVEGAEQFSVTLSNPAGATLGDPIVATVTIIDDDTAQTFSLTANPIDDSAIFVGQTYHDFLSRQADPGGQTYWTGEITACGSDPLCINARRIGVSNAFFFEQEYQQTGAFVFRLYRAAYGNSQPIPNPDTDNPAEAGKLPSYAAFVADRARVVGGVSLSQSQLTLARAFIRRPEFLAKYPDALDGSAFISAILDTIKNDSGVDLSSQQSALLNLFYDGGRAAVIYRLADDNLATNPLDNRAFIDAEYRRAFVATEYFGYLRRDGDIAGLLFWLNQVNRFPLRDTTIQNAMVCSFITSTEYQQRFGSVVTHSNAECPQ